MGATTVQGNECDQRSGSWRDLKMTTLAEMEMGVVNSHIGEMIMKVVKIEVKIVSDVHE